jgi:hypothetical protein
MIHRNKISEIARKLVKPNNISLRSLQIMHPNREWGIGLLLAVLIFAGSGIWSAKTYLSYRNFSVDEDVEIETSTVVYRETLVENALKIFASKKLNFDELADKENTPLETSVPSATSTDVEVSEDELIKVASGTSDSSIELDSGTSSPKLVNDLPILSND